MTAQPSTADTTDEIAYPPIQVLLAAYNGAPYIAAQIQSIKDQDYEGPVHVVVRDDGSTDQTVAIVRDLMQQPWPALRSLHLLERTEGPQGVVANFNALLLHAHAPYVALADQDDIWIRSKLRLQMEAMRRVEGGWVSSGLSEEKRWVSSDLNEDTHATYPPFLVCTDLQVVDRQLQPIAASMWHLQKLDPRWASDWRSLLVQNMVTGCTCLLNQAALHAALPLPYKEGVYHDQWLGVIASRYGRVIPLAIPTVCYRQHGHNVVAAHRFTLGFALRKLTHFFTTIQRSYWMAQQLQQPISKSALLGRKIYLNLRRLLPHFRSKSL